jgi:hypothetical protein
VALIGGLKTKSDKESRKVSSIGVLEDKIEKGRQGSIFKVVIERQTKCS